MTKFSCLWLFAGFVSACTPADLGSANPDAALPSNHAGKSIAEETHTVPPAEPAEATRTATAGQATAVPDKPARAALTVWSGLYTSAQAQEGAALYQQECALCHGARYTGTMGAPALKGPAFEFDWADKTVEDLFTYIHTSMPPSEPGKLSLQSYLAITATILDANGFPPASDNSSLAVPVPKARIERRPAD